MSRSHLSLDSRLSQRGFLIKPTVNQKQTDRLDPKTERERKRERRREEVRRRCLLPAVTGEASTTRCRVASEQTNLDVERETLAA